MGEEKDLDFLEVEALRVIWEVLQNETEREKCRNSIERVTFDKGEVIYEEGSAVKYVYFLEHGILRLFRKGINGKNYITRLLSQGQVFGLRAFLTKDVRHSTVETSTEVSVYRIESETLSYLLEHNNKICQYVMAIVTREMNNAERRTMSLLQKYTRGRLAETLLLLISYYGFKEDGQTLNVNPSRKELGELSNMTTSNAIRTLSEFAKEGVLELLGRQIKVIDIKGLENISKIG